MVVFDATILLLTLDPTTPAPLDPTTGKPVSQPKERVDYLIQNLEEERTKIIIPTPVLSEILVRAGKAGPSYLSIIEKSSAFKIEPFDIRAAIEVAHMAGGAIVTGKKKGPSVQTYAKVKYDRQIVAIGKTLSATVIYTDDKDLKALAETYGLKVIRISELPIPPEDPQITMY